MGFKEVKIEVYIPGEFNEILRDRLTKIGACKLGNYDHCISITEVKGYWRPLNGSNPYKGEQGKICSGSECKIEARCKIEFVNKAIKVIKEVHPYEEPLINIVPIINDLFE